MNEKGSLTDKLLKNLQWIILGFCVAGIGAWVGYVLDATASEKHGIQVMEALNHISDYLNPNDIIASQLAVFRFGAAFIGWLIGAIVGLLVVFYFTWGNEEKRYHRKGVEHGSARWGDANEKQTIADMNDFYNNAILASDVMLVVDRKKREENAMSKSEKKKRETEEALKSDIENIRRENLKDNLLAFYEKYDNVRSNELYVVENGVLLKYNGCGDEMLLIPENITSIGKFAFAENKSVVEIDTANVVSIGYGAFYGCTSLRSVVCSNVEKIEDSAFEKCVNLYDITFNDKLSEIKDKAFELSGNVMFHVPDNVSTYAEKYAAQKNIFTIKYTPKGKVPSPIEKNKKISTFNVISRNNKAKKIKPMLNLNMLILGGTGTGKSRFFVTPNLCQCNTSYVITDPSGELLQATGKMLQRNGYDVRVFNLDHMEHSKNYNPFNYLYETNAKGERKYNESYVIKMIQVFMDNTKGEGGNGADPFWDNATKMLLSACCFYLVETAPPEKQNFTEVLNIIHTAVVDENASKEEKSLFDCIFEERRKEDEKALSVQFYDEFHQAAGKTMQSILISTTVRLQLFKLKQVENLTWEDNISLETIGDKKTALFIIIPTTNETYNFLAAMMYTQLFDSLYSRAINVYGGKLPVHVRFILDEFANVGKIPNFEKILATMRKFELSAQIILQNLTQLKRLYEKSWEEIPGNCDTTIFLGGKDQSNNEYIMKELGKETIDTLAINKTYSKQSSTSNNNAIMGRELMTQDELATMPNNQCLILVRGIRPFKTDKFDIINHPNYSMLAEADANGRNTYLVEKEIAVEEKIEPLSFKNQGFKKEITDKLNRDSIRVKYYDNDGTEITSMGQYLEKKGMTYEEFTNLTANFDTI